jgi:hypothetical protein
MKKECRNIIYTRVAGEGSTVCLIDTPLFGPMFHKKGQLKQPLIYLGIALEKLGVSNSKEIIDAYVTREATPWIRHRHDRNSSTGNCLQKL